MDHRYLLSWLYYFKRDGKNEIIKMEKKEKKKKANTTNGKGGPKRNRGNNARGRNGLRGRGARTNKRNIGTLKKEQKWQRGQNANIRGSFTKKRFIKNGGVASQSLLALNQKANVRGNVNVRRGRGNRYGLTRSRSRTNLTITKAGFFTANKATLKRTNSVGSVRDPTSVHNRLGYQSPAQIAYRNHVKRAKQLLLQRQNQRLNFQNQFRMLQAGKSPLSLQQRPLERRQQILTSQRRFTTGGLRSDQIARAQRRSQYEQKLMRMNSARITPSNVNFMCTLGNDYTPNTHEHSMSLAQNRNERNMSGLQQLLRGRSPITQTIQNLNMIGRSPVFGRQRSRSRSRSRSRTRNVPMSDSGADLDDRTFSKIMYSISASLGVTGRTLNDRFSF
ncbi:PREDICTED: uncharacterized protein LOC106785935 isoform X1 [Polistes canadensis]|uniref:uncharacterized protein LOC106785935 isoform X1 n=2 Tax=Polistes canadensis TaxID=91411 RepID=UPI000718BB17|nr:PREDICTED: uncharacterized protein LOC106785935 isoform X1 [Polistes canadensis]KAI4492544.1 hypothetical protein M0804_002335 [Polistes exclamans]